jgi:hypothetical protein
MKSRCREFSPIHSLKISWNSLHFKEGRESQKNKEIVVSDATFP